jgi:hypothetical protein
MAPAAKLSVTLPAIHGPHRVDHVLDLRRAVSTSQTQEP